MSDTPPIDILAIAQRRYKEVVNRYCPIDADAYAVNNAWEDLRAVFKLMKELESVAAPSCTTTAPVIRESASTRG